MKCPYCGADMSESDKLCPHCGAWNGVPKTIEELKEFCRAYELPLERMRFFIGEDYKEPKAFGIFRNEDGKFVVYKNKADGTRAIRYQGPDEAYAVNELYQKMKSEVELRQAKQSGAAAAPDKGKKKKKLREILGGVIFIAVLVAWLWLKLSAPSTGYYCYDDDYYYYQDSSWYTYDSGGWYRASSLDGDFKEHPDDYWLGSSYSGSYDIQDFEDSPYYHESSNDSSSGVFDSWNSSDTDWDSDW